MTLRRTAIASVIALTIIGLAGTVHALGTGFDRTLLLEGDPVAVAVDAQTSRAFVINGLDNTVTVLDTRSGDRMRSVPVGEGALDLAVDTNASRVFVLNNGDSSVSMLDAYTGVPVRTLHLSVPPELISVDVQAGHVFISSTTSTKIMMLASATGRLLRTIPLAHTPLALDVDQHLDRLLVVGTRGVQMFDARSGARLRDLDPHAYTASMTIDEQTGQAFILDGGADRLDAVDLRTGSVTFSVPLSPYPVAVAVDGRSGRVYVANAANVYSVAGSYRITTFSADTGALLGSTQIESAVVSMLADNADGKILVDIGTGIVVLNGGTGAIAYVEPVYGTRITGAGMAVDPGTGHAFAVATYEGEPDAADPPLVAWLRNWLPFLPHPPGAREGSIQEWTIGQ